MWMWQIGCWTNNLFHKKQYVWIIWAEREGVTEQLKADSQMEWVARMNNIRSSGTETANHDIIYV